MIDNLNQILNYGVFVWSAFGIVILFCSIFYIKTKKTMLKHERDFSRELEKLSIEEKQKLIKNSKIASRILLSQKNTI
jgi:heme exporter protein D